MPKKMKLLSAFVLATSACPSASFSPFSNKPLTVKNSVGQRETVEHIAFRKIQPLISTCSSQRSSHLPRYQLQLSDSPDSETPVGFWNDISINPPYAVAFVTFLTFAFYRSFTEPEGASMQILEGFFADPLNPGCNELFVAVFNLLGLYFVPLACLLMPGAKGQKFPATPFVLASMLGGYGFLGPYMITRKPSYEQMSKESLGWITANILENKTVNWVVVALVSSAYISSGCVSAVFDDPNKLINGYWELFSETAIASASSMDFLILTLVAASLVPEDLAKRGVKGGIAPYAIAASTALLPGAGAVLYCALRPELE